MRLRATSITAVFALLVVAMLGSSPVGAVVGGELTTDPPPYVATLIRNGGAFEGALGCTASVIAPSYILTAAHCVTGGYTNGDTVQPDRLDAIAERRQPTSFDDRSTIRVAVGTIDQYDAPIQFGVRQVYIHPDFAYLVEYETKKGEPAPKKCEDRTTRSRDCRKIAGNGTEWDFAILELDEPIPPEYGPVTLGSVDDVVGPSIAYGYGVFKDNGKSLDGLLRQTLGDETTDRQCLDEVNEFELPVPFEPPSPDFSGWYCAKVPGSHTQWGDSGGPHIRDVGGEAVQVGMTSFGDHKEDYAHIADIGAAQQWIRSVAGLAGGGDDILIIGGTDHAAVPATQANLEALGYTVIHETWLPTNLSPYAAVFYIEWDDAPSLAGEDLLASFVEQGGGLYMTGERPCCETLNLSADRLVQRLVRDPGVSVITVDANYAMAPIPLNPTVVYGIDDTPNTVTQVTMDAPGGMTGVEAENVVAEINGYTVAAVWGDAELQGGQGRFALFMDINWLDTDPDPALLLENVARFLTTR